MAAPSEEVTVLTQGMSDVSMQPAPPGLSLTGDRQLMITDEVFAEMMEESLLSYFVAVLEPRPSQRLQLLPRSQIKGWAELSQTMLGIGFRPEHGDSWAALGIARPVGAKINSPW